MEIARRIGALTWNDGQALTACCNGQVILYRNPRKVMIQRRIDPTAVIPVLENVCLKM